MNYLVLTGPQGDETEFAGLFASEADAFTVASKAEDRGEFCLIFALEQPHYATAEAANVPND